MTRIIECNRKHDFQDQKYGKNKRVHNRLKKDKGATTQKFRCTVCQDVKMK